MPMAPADTAVDKPQLIFCFFCFLPGVTKETVTSPGWPLLATTGTGTRTTAVVLPVKRVSSQRSSTCTLSQSKCRHPRMMRAAAGSARISVRVPEPGSWRSVASSQWSLPYWLMMTRSGSGSSESKDATVRSRDNDDDNTGFTSVAEVEWEGVTGDNNDGFVITGSSRIVNGRGLTETSEATELGKMGSNDSRNDVSEFSCLIVNAIVSDGRRQRPSGVK